MTVATALAVSWNPLTNSNANAIPMAITRNSIELVLNVSASGMDAGMKDKIMATPS